jgi:hypothetical protein
MPKLNGLPGENAANEGISIACIREAIAGSASEPQRCGSR